MKTLFVGDVSVAKDNAALFCAKDTATLFGDVPTLFAGNDFNFVNLECALTDCESSIEKFGPPLKAPAETAEVLKRLGVHCCGLSNNHIFDFGKQGYFDTVAALNAAGVAYTGFGENYDDSRRNFVCEVNGERLAVIAVCEHEYSYALTDRMGSRPFDEFDTMLDIRAAKAEAARVVVVYHGGKEHCRYPSPRLRRACRAMVRNGADLVLCQHSHCIGCYEQFEGGHILYGQGNFHFEWEFPTRPASWVGCLAVSYDTVRNSVEFTPVTSNGRGGIRLAEGAEAEEMLSAFAARNEELKNGAWERRWQEFCERSRAQYERVIGNACRPEAEEKHNKLFGHFLDCEAHTDVWRALFPTANQTNEK
jgi:poly-gamma-glutamate synthesis protein (capsule biosynthesis protein)